MTGRSLAWLLVGLLAAPVLAAPETGFPPTMPPAARRHILQVAGFDLSPDLRSATRQCGEKTVRAGVGIGRRDIDGDGRDEFVVLSQNECPGANGKLHAVIVTRDASGQGWQAVLDADGQPHFAPQPGKGWPSLAMVDGARSTDYVYVSGDARYLPVATVRYRENLARARVPDHTAPGQLPTAGWARPWDRGALSPGQLAQIMIAAGYRRGATGWTGCDGKSTAALAEGDDAISDLNGDGQPEVVVRDDSFECYENSGGRFVVLSPVPGGWKKIGEGQDTPLFLDTRSRAGWRDYEEGGPGFCHRRDRNEGRGYRDAGPIEDSPGACSE